MYLVIYFAGTSLEVYAVVIIVVALFSGIGQILNSIQYIRIHVITIIF